MKKINIIALAVLIVLQLIILGGMLIKKQNIIAEGKVYRFKTRPIDPNDPFRGKYITLSFEIQNYNDVRGGKNWKKNDEVWVRIAEDYNGFAKIVELKKNQPKSDNDYVKALISRVNKTDYGLNLFIKFPFNRLYIEESKARLAERLYRKFTNIDSLNVYAKVRVKNGDAVLEDVFVCKAKRFSSDYDIFTNEKPISKAVEEHMKEIKENELRND